MERGKTAIKKYAKQQAGKHIKKRKEINIIGGHLGRKRFYPMLVEHKDELLKGVIF